MHMRVDATREREAILGVKDLAGVIGLNFRLEPGDLSILDRNIKTINRGIVRPNHARVLNNGIEKLVHARHSLATVVSCYPALVSNHIACRAPAFPACRSVG